MSEIYSDEKTYIEISYEPTLEKYYPVSFDINIQLFANPEDEGRTEEPTEYKKKKAREEGRVARSTELISGVMLIASLWGLALFGPYIQNGIKEIFTVSIERSYHYALSNESFGEVLKFALLKMLTICAPIFGIAFIVALVMNFFQVGFMFTTKPLEPKMEKLKPKFQRIFFSRTTAFNLVKSLFKVFLVAFTLYFMISNFTGKLLRLGEMNITRSWNEAGNITLLILSVVSGILLLLSVVDFFYQKWDYKQNLRMSRYEMKEERKDTDGDPFVKQRLRDKMRELTSKRMMDNIPEADVLVTNPTHYAVAIKYDENIHQAPIVSSKGQGYIALKIKEIAKENDVPIIENKPLARALYDQVEIGDIIPEDFYVAVAEILAYVYRIKNKVPDLYQD